MINKIIPRNAVDIRQHLHIHGFFFHTVIYALAVGRAVVHEVRTRPVDLVVDIESFRKMIYFINEFINLLDFKLIRIRNRFQKSEFFYFEKEKHEKIKKKRSKEKRNIFCFSFRLFIRNASSRTERSAAVKIANRRKSKTFF